MKGLLRFYFQVEKKKRRSCGCFTLPNRFLKASLAMAGAYATLASEATGTVPVREIFPSCMFLKNFPELFFIFGFVINEV